MDATRSGDDHQTPLRRRTDKARLRAATLPADAIARRAYELFLQRGSQDGNDIDDWLRAEQELRMPKPRTD